MADTSLQVQGAIFDLLSASSSIADKVKKRIFDTVPNKVGFPYINLAPFDSITEETKDKDGQMHSVQIDTWSRARGQKETREIVAAVRNAVHRVPLSITGGNVLYSRVTNTRLLMDSDKRTIHGIVEMEIKVLSD